MTIESQEQTQSLDAFSIRDIETARTRIAAHAVVTPMVSNPQLDSQTGGRVFLKCENLQRTGSFKFRGAYNALAAMSNEERARGILAVSSGNHAQGVAEAARLFDVPATIVMPHDAPAIKVARVKRSGAIVIGYDRNTEDRDAIAQTILSQTGAVFVHPFENRYVMAGQGTSGLEAADYLRDHKITPDVALSCCGGGGLTAGASTALRASFADINIYAVEPEAFDDTARSLASGKRERNVAGAISICDALLTPMPGAQTFPINQRNGVKALQVSDRDVLEAIAFAFNELKMVVEPGGVVCLAALLAGKIDVRDQTVIALISGGNIDPAMMARALNA